MNIKWNKLHFFARSPHFVTAQKVETNGKAARAALLVCKLLKLLSFGWSPAESSSSALDIAVFLGRYTFL